MRLFLTYQILVKAKEQYSAYRFQKLQASSFFRYKSGSRKLPPPRRQQAHNPMLDCMQPKSGFYWISLPLVAFQLQTTAPEDRPAFVSQLRPWKAQAYSSFLS